mgnify:CR=1 FL=1
MDRWGQPIPQNPALAAYLAQTPAAEGGAPQTAMPDPPMGDSMLEAPPAPPASQGTPARSGGGDPWETATVALAQLQAKKPKARPMLRPSPRPSLPYTLSALLGG